MKDKLIAFLWAEGAYALRLIGGIIIGVVLAGLLILSIGLGIAGHWVAGLLVFLFSLYGLCRWEDRL
jgi:hypothetical protein